MHRLRSSKVAAKPGIPAPLFAALGDETRLRLVLRLCKEGLMSITGLATGSGVTRQAVTKHLRVMEEAGLLRSARRGRESVWRLSERRLEDARRYLDQISKQWDDALGRLREWVEDNGTVLSDHQISKTRFRNILKKLNCGLPNA